MTDQDFRDEIAELAEGARQELREHERKPSRTLNPEEKRRLTLLLWVGGLLTFAEILLLVGQLALAPETRPDTARYVHPLMVAESCNGARYRAFRHLRAFRKDHGEWPPTLEALVPEYVSSMPIDPETGLHLQYRRTGEGFDMSCAAGAPSR